MAADCTTAADSVSSRPEGQDSLHADQGSGFRVEAENFNRSSMYEAASHSDDFNMYHYKVQACPKGCTPTKWGTCGYAHHGEKARRRDPRMGYVSVACPDMLKSGKCPRGDSCGMAHSAFEFWLHPQRYRTAMCRDGERCPRSVCFFAHSQAQLRKAGYPTTDSDGNPLPRPKFSLSGLKTQQPQVPAAVAASTAAAGQPVQQVACQVSSSSCSNSRCGSLDSTCSAIAGGAFSEQSALPCCNSTVLGHNSCGSFEVLPMPLAPVSGSGMPTAARLATPNVLNGTSSNSSPISCGFTYAPPSSTHVQYNSSEINGSGIPAPVGVVEPDANVLLPALLERLSSTQQQAQLAQQAADAANGQLAALYQALGISADTTGRGCSANSGMLSISANSTVADAPMLSPSTYSLGCGSDINIGSLSSGQFACLSTPQNSEGLVLLNDTGSTQSAAPVMNILPVPGSVQPMTSFVSSNTQLASAAQAWLPPCPTRVGAATTTGSNAMYISGVVPQGCLVAAAADGSILPAQQQLSALQVIERPAVHQQAVQWGDAPHQQAVQWGDAPHQQAVQWGDAPQAVQMRRFVLLPSGGVNWV